MLLLGRILSWRAAAQRHAVQIAVSVPLADMFLAGAQREGVVDRVRASGTQRQSAELRIDCRSVVAATQHVPFYTTTSVTAECDRPCPSHFALPGQRAEACTSPEAAMANVAM